MNLSTKFLRYFVLILIGAGMVSCSWLAWERRCQPSVVSSVIVKDTAWVGEVRSVECNGGYNMNGGTDVRLVNTKTGKTIEVAVGMDVVLYKLSSDKEHELTLTLPNRSFSRLLPVLERDIKVHYVFTPSFNALDRAQYLAWYWGDRKMEENRKWFCENFFADLPPKSRPLEDRVLSKTILGPDTNQGYCLR